MYVIPKPGLVIRDPDLKTLVPPEGREVPDAMYWQRLIMDGDVTVGKAPSVSSGSKSS